jgi:hypothetical protein
MSCSSNLSNWFPSKADGVGSKNLWELTVSTSLDKILTAVGYFKATFDGKIDKQDTVGMSLYKRIWPKLGV